MSQGEAAGVPATGSGSGEGEAPAFIPDNLVQQAARELEQRFTMLAEAIPQLVWSTDRHGMLDYVNSGWTNYTGQTLAAAAGDGWQRCLHPDDAESTRRIWNEAVADTGRYDLEYRLRGADGHYRWFLARGRAVLDDAGQPNRWIGTCTDIHETRLAADHNAALSLELGHRIKNIFAVIDGLIGMSIRQQPELASVGRDLQQRVLALGRAHDFVRPHSETSRPTATPGTLAGMLAQLLAPYRGPAGTERIAITGGDVTIDDRSATPLALAFHELATNAAKYGALSVPNGMVEVGISPAQDIVRLSWQEAGGPVVAAPAQSGFGSRLVDISLCRQLDGEVEWHWHSEGLCFAASIPRSNMARG